MAGADATLYTDKATVYRSMREEHHAVNHSVGQYVDGQASVKGVESFWSMLKRGYHGTYHKISPGHLQRYTDEFAGRTTSAPSTPRRRWPGWSRGWWGGG